MSGATGRMSRLPNPRMNLRNSILGAEIDDCGGQNCGDFVDGKWGKLGER